jgi:hypothetical protein
MEDDAGGAYEAVSLAEWSASTWDEQPAVLNLKAHIRRFDSSSLKVADTES